MIRPILEAGYGGRRRLTKRRSEIRNPKHETNPEHKMWDVRYGM
jgi:hypothetical protein